MSDRGTLGYGTQTYDPLTPYFKGLHITIDGWRPDRYSDGCKVATSRPKSAKLTEAYFFLNSASCQETDNPEKRLLSDLNALVEIMSIETAPIMLVESSKFQYIKYGFVDTSGGGFGVTIEVEAVLDIETGTCNTLGSQKLSNFRSLSNLV